MGIVESKAKLGWLMTSFLLAYGFSCMFLSFLGDLINPKKLILERGFMGCVDVYDGLHHHVQRYGGDTYLMSVPRRVSVCLVLQHYEAALQRS